MSQAMQLGLFVDGEQLTWGNTGSGAGATRREQGSVIRRCIAWRNRRTSDPQLHRIIERGNVA